MDGPGDGSVVLNLDQAIFDYLNKNLKVEVNVYDKTVVVNLLLINPQTGKFQSIGE